MGVLTNFLKLIKPSYTDPADIAEINSNMDKIDSHLKSLDDGTKVVNKATNATNATNATSATAATKLQTARTINGVAFDGTKNITVADSTKASLSHTHTKSNITDFPTSLPANGGTSAACSGNAATATKLATARTINGVAFDGSANITVADGTKAPTNHRSANNTYGLGTTAYFGHVAIKNDLNASAYADGQALSAYQGFILKGLIDNANPTPINYSGSIPANTTIVICTFDINKQTGLSLNYSGLTRTAHYEILRPNKFVGYQSNSSNEPRSASFILNSIDTQINSSSSTTAKVMARLVNSMVTISVVGGSTTGTYDIDVY